MAASTPPTTDVLAGMPDSIPIDDALTTLAHPERRQLLVVLGELETPEPMSALTRSLAALAAPSENEAVDRVLIRLYHVHVPKLVEAGMVSYDDEDGTVELTDRGDGLVEALGG